MQRQCVWRSLTARQGLHPRHVHTLHRSHCRRRLSPPAAAAGGTLVGIDLGTSNSAIAVIQNGKARILPDDNGSTITASVVSYTEDSVLVGAPALKGDAADTFYSVKRLIGRTLAEVASDVAGLRYEVVACGADEHGATPKEVSEEALSSAGEEHLPDGVRLHCPARGGALLPEQVSAELLRHLLARGEGHLGSAVTNAVVTVPAHFGPERRKATHRAARLAGLQAVTLLQEPVAAAIAYGLGKPTDADTILVLDLGGGTLDVSILESFEGIIEVLATDGDSNLGGDDFDRAIALWALERCRQQGHAVSDADIKGVMASAEAAKVALSSAEAAAVSVPLPDGTRADVPLSRGEFEAAVQPLLRRIWAPMERAGSAVFLEWADRPFETQSAAAADSSINDGSGIASSAELGRFAPPPRRATKTLLVGGGTYVPAVQRLVEQATGIVPVAGLDPELCVALGAGMQAGILEGVLEGPLEVMDGAYVQNLHGRTTGVAGFDVV